MDFKSKVPPITIRLSASVLPTIKLLLHKDSRLVYRSSKITVRASSLDEYKTILRTAADNHMEFYTHNPVISNVSKSVLRGLPVDTSSDVILDELSAQGFVISAICQMWRPVTAADGVRSRHLMPLWVLTHHQDVKPSLRALTGLLHFRVTVEDLKYKDIVSQCYRCQEFGHPADFCKFPVKCSICAEDHDSSQCSSKALPSRKCSNCSCAHLASSWDCPARLRSAASLRRSSSSSHPPLVPSAFSPLPIPLPSPPVVLDEIAPAAFFS